MFCTKCGKKIPEDAVFCPYCGAKVSEEVLNSNPNPNSSYNPTQQQYQEVRFMKKTTFGEAVKALFSKIFVFKGLTGQREFNYGLLFLLIISCVASVIIIAPELSGIYGEILNSGVFNEQEYYASIEALMISEDIFSPFNLYNIGMALITSAFFVAPVYRRMSDAGKSNGFALACAIIFVVSEIACSTLFYCLFTTEVYNSLTGIIDILSIANLVILLMCIFSKSKNRVYY